MQLVAILWERLEYRSVGVQFISVQSLSRVQLFATPWIAAHQASLSITSSQSLLTLMTIESVMPSSHLILCRPLLLLPPIQVFSKSHFIFIQHFSSVELFDTVCSPVRKWSLKRNILSFHWLTPYVSANRQCSIQKVVYRGDKSKEWDIPNSKRMLPR